MSRATWADLKAEAVLELRDRADISTRTERWLREAYMEVAYNYRFYELEKTVDFSISTNVQSVTFAAIGAADLKHIFSLRDNTSGRKIRKTNFREIDKHQIDSGEPRSYCRFGSEIIFDTRANSSISIKMRYRKHIVEPVFSSTDTDFPVNSPDTPDEWDEVIRLLAVARGFNALFEWDTGGIKQSQAAVMIATLVPDNIAETEDDDFGVVVRNR